MSSAVQAPIHSAFSTTGLDHSINDLEALKVKKWRLELQCAFLYKHGIPKAEDMPKYDRLFTMIEKTDISIEQLQWQSLILASEFAGIMIADGANEETIPENNEKIEKAAFAGEENNVE
ncbi:hypothetical protein M422DRAFT_32854 [Sphaerobolus stellatus SS14]|uniref:Uncharacterized protein n=1 Tax=Sphaerobolus stellatus (strain SS14) TaxID=990650 RepID=A0A0C9VMP1_SPHS4|nr:hypothetical protein M422DRAFT_32854 [Sphaerobolus stellatus SS14]